MVTTAATIFDSEVVAAEPRGITANTKILSILRQRIRNTNSNEVCLVVCKGPTDLLAVHKIDNWRRRFRYLAAWIIDSFWLDHLPTSIRLRNPFDHIFVTSLEDVDLWKKITGVATTWLPWGTDALRLGQAGGPREWDLTRVGRQPPEWENDFDAASAAELLGIKYRGRPDSSGLSTLQNQQMMMHSYGSTKFTLAFSNAVNRDPNNHPTREYLTGRWVDALGQRFDRSRCGTSGPQHRRAALARSNAGIGRGEADRGSSSRCRSDQKLDTGRCRMQLPNGTE